MSSRLWLCSAAILLASGGPVMAQGPSPLELVRGLRESGMSDLALEYLKEIENKPLSPLDKQAIPLERAKCLLEAAEDEPDEGTRTSMVGEAKDGFNEFLVKSPSHPRSSEASIALARLTSIDAKIQLNHARRIDVGDDEKLRKQQREESAAARPLFLLASRRFAEAGQQIKNKLNDASLDPATKAALAREAFNADLAAAINQYMLADTFLATDAKETIERAKYFEKAREEFGKLAKGSSTSRTAWIGKAWMAETLMDLGKPNDAEAEFKSILASNLAEAEEGKRIVRFFQARRNYLNALQDRTPAKLLATERELRSWLNRYGSAGKATPEAISVRFYLAFTLQLQADFATPRPKTGPLVVGATARRQFDEAEKLYRVLSQSDNDYTARASRNRMHVVRMLIGEADKAVNEYTAFEAAQMASLIQMAKLSDAEKELPKFAQKAEQKFADKRALAYIGAELNKRKIEAEVKSRKERILALLERARELATDKDSVGDVNDVLLRQVYYYQLSNQPYEAAVLGEHVARTVKSTGGKAALAGLLAINGYIIASSKLRLDAIDPNNKAALDAALAARRIDRERAAALARFLDERFPNDTATDAARHRLASMMVEDRQLDKAFEMLVKVHPGYNQIASVRLLEGYIAAQLINSTAKDVPLPSGGKQYLFHKAIADLERVAKPALSAREDEVTGYLSVQARLALLYLSHSRVENKPGDIAGFEKALAIADKVIGETPSFDCLKGKETGGLSPKGLEMQYLGFDARTRAIYLRGKVFVDAANPNWEKAAAAIEPIIADIEKGSMYDDKMKQWAGSADDDEMAKVKARVSALAQAIDRTRKEIVMVGFKLRVRQGKSDEASKMLGLIGNIEENQSTLEFMARDLAAQIVPLKKAGKTAEAAEMGKGLAILLKKLSELKNLTTSSILFLGQTLYLVEQYEDALKEFAKIVVPAPPVPKDVALPKGREWWNYDLNKFGWFKLSDPIFVMLKNEGVPDAILGKLKSLNDKVMYWDDFEKEVKKVTPIDEMEKDPEKKKAEQEKADQLRSLIMNRAEISEVKQEKKRFQDQIRDYRLAQLYTARSLRGAKKLAEAEKLLTTAIGVSEKQGYAYASLDFRKELAMTHENKAAAIATPKEANLEWGKAMKEWSTLFSFASNQITKTKEPSPEVDKHLKNTFYEAFFEIQRCLVAANTQLLKGNPKLAQTFADVGKKLFNMETTHKFAEREAKGNGIINPDVWNRYCDLIDKYPELKNAYKAAGGKFFLERPKEE